MMNPLLVVGRFTQPRTTAVASTETNWKPEATFTLPTAAPATGPLLPLTPSWSPNGAAIDYIHVDAGAGNIWRQPLNGDPPSQITQVTTGELFRIVRSTDGAHLGIVRGNHSSALVLITDLQ
jgi:hypothetical protein